MEKEKGKRLREPPGNKLQTETRASKSRKEKLRFEKADTAMLVLSETEKRCRELQKQNILKRVTAPDNKKQEEEQSTEKESLYLVTESTGELAEHTASSYGKKLKKSSYETSFLGTKPQEEAPAEMQKSIRKKEIQKSFQKREAAKGKRQLAGQGIQSMWKKEKKEKVIRMTKAVTMHPAVFLIPCLFLGVLFCIVAGLSSCSMGGFGTGQVTVASTYTAEDEVIVEVEASYQMLEAEIAAKIEEVEREHPGYDEYCYRIAEIGHDPYQLAALLTILYEDYSREEAEAILPTLLEEQYTFTLRGEIQIREREVEKIGYYPVELGDGLYDMVEYTYIDIETYEYEILHVTLTNHGMDEVAKEQIGDADKILRYELLKETKGNKAYLFTGESYIAQNDPLTYEIPGEALTDSGFAAMMAEAEKYIGMPFVWGGSTPESGFDCSGYVCHVLNTCGYGVGRTSANGLKNYCDVIRSQEAKPGDLIFFQGTYETKGASHVGIYVGDGKMIHCGNPISYADLNNAYWQKHFYCYGRLP